MHKFQQRLVAMLVILHTQTGLYNLNIQVQIAESTSVDTQYNFLTSAKLHMIIRAQINYNAR